MNHSNFIDYFSENQLIHLWNFYSLITSMKINWFASVKYFFAGESVKRQITDPISENLIDLDFYKKIEFFKMTECRCNAMGSLDR